MDLFCDSIFYLMSLGSIFVDVRIIGGQIIGFIFHWVRALKWYTVQHAIYDVCDITSYLGATILFMYRPRIPK